MRHILLAFLIVAGAAQAQDDPKATPALVQFEDGWKKAGNDESARVQLVTGLSLYTSAKILKSLTEKFDKERSSAVRAEMAKAIGNHVNSPEAAKFLIDRIDKWTDEKVTFQALLKGLANIKNVHTRPYAKRLNGYVENKDARIVLPVVSALSVIRDKSSVVPLMKRLRKLQNDIRTYINGEKLKDCDGD